MEKCKACLEIEDIEKVVNIMRREAHGSDYKMMYHLKTWHCTCKPQVKKEESKS